MGLSLGLDISTSCTGFCILDDDCKLIKIDFIRLDNIDNFFEKSDKVEEVFNEIKKEFNIANVFIEQNLQAFRPGLSSASTIDTLARFNGTVTYIAYKVFGVKPTAINVIAARSAVGLKIDHKDKSRTTKEKVFAWVFASIPVNWPTNKKGGFKPSCFDMADSYVITKAGILLNVKR